MHFVEQLLLAGLQIDRSAGAGELDVGDGRWDRRVDAVVNGDVVTAAVDAGGCCREPAMRAEFEVVSLKPSAPGVTQRGSIMPGGAHNAIAEGLAAVLVLGGLLIFEWCFVMAGQSVPNS